MRSAVPSRGLLLSVATVSLALITGALPAAATSSHSDRSSSQARSWAHAGGADHLSDVTIRRDQRGHAHYVGAAAGHVLARNTDETLSSDAAARR